MTNSTTTKLACAFAAFVLTTASFAEVTDSKVPEQGQTEAQLALNETPGAVT